jgi:ketosteroid isomerase-like protein
VRADRVRALSFPVLLRGANGTASLRCAHLVPCRNVRPRLTVDRVRWQPAGMLRSLIAILLAVCLAAPTAQAAPKSAADPTPAAQVALAWLAALAAKDLRKLSDVSTVPFTFVTDYKREKCDGVANDEKARRKIFRCLVSDEKILIDELQYMQQNTVIQGAEPKGAQAIKDVLPKLRGLVNSLGTAEGQSLVGGYLNGDGIVFEFLFAVRPADGKLRVSGLALAFEVHE